MAGPTEPRRRRRPALSCVECRRRKVRCDRNSPCGQCRAHKSTVCTYAVDRATGLERQSSQRSQGPVVQTAADQDASVLQRPASSSPSLLIDESTVPVVSIVSDGPALCIPQDSDRNNNIPQSSSTPQAPPGPFQGTLSKTRVFGHGHWMSSLPLVRHPTMCRVLAPDQR
jgi:hypothetical protein